MIRDTFFSMPRFVNLCRKDMVENWKANVLRMVLMYGMTAIIFIWNGYIEYTDRNWEGVTEDPAWAFDIVTFIGSIVLMGCLSASFIMERMKTKTGRTAMLMTPATMFEKFFSRWLVFTFGFLIMFLISFKLADWTRVLYFTAMYPEVSRIAPVPLSAYLVGPAEHWTAFDNCDKFMFGVSFYFLLQSCFVLGSSIWAKNAFLKTFAAGVVIVIVYLLIGAGLVKVLFPDNYMENKFLTDEQAAFWGAILCSLAALFNWVLAYFRFKESEIINRW